MVNMPHPSYYMNHNPAESCFRQLQILEFAQACRRLWGRGKKKHGWQTFGEGAGLEPRFCSTVSLTHPACFSVLTEETGVIPRMKHLLLSALHKP